MQEPAWRSVLTDTLELALGHLESLPTRHVGSRATLDQLRASMDVPLTDDPVDPGRVVADLATAADPGIIASPGARFFGFVVGGSVPAALAADWLTSTWDQNASLYAAGPAASVAEEVVAKWLLDLLALPPGASVGLVTGAQMANTTGLLVARDEVLRRSGWDCAQDGLFGAPEVTVVVGEQRHASLDLALRYAGLGSRRVRVAEADGQGRMRTDALRDELAGVEGPLIVCAQAGNVNTGAVDPLGAAAELTHERGGWLHIDGAFGLWARVSDDLRGLTEGAELADSWATDAHKWLNVPYDCGVVICADPVAHERAMRVSAPYLVRTDGRDNYNWVPELSRRGRGFAAYAALRSLGRRGVVELIERCCSNARRAATALGREEGVQILNDVVLNQVLLRFGDDDTTEEVIRRVQAEGTCWVGPGTVAGNSVMRFSVSNWSTTEHDIDASVDAIVKCFSAARADPQR